MSRVHILRSSLRKRNQLRSLHAINKANFYKCRLQLDGCSAVGLTVRERKKKTGKKEKVSPFVSFLLLGIKWCAIATTLVGSPQRTSTKAIVTSQPIRDRSSNGLLIPSRKSGRAATIPAHLMNSIRTKLQLNNFSREQPVKSDRRNFNLQKELQ